MFQETYQKASYFFQNNFYNFHHIFHYRDNKQILQDCF